MKIKRFSNSGFVTLYHVTKKENLPSIKREGLKTKYYKQRDYYKYMGIKDTGLIYLVKDKSKLVKPLKDDRYVLVTIKIPTEVYNRMDKIEGDPEYWASNQDANLWKELVADSFRKTYPEKFGKMSTREIMKDATPFEYGSPENSVCIKEDIDPKYIVNIDKNMKIKRFSKINTNEKLYSVLMSEEELALFSNLINEDPFEFLVEDVFYVTGRGPVLTGKVVSGTVCSKDKVILNNKSYKVKELVSPGKKSEKAIKGNKIGICLEGLSKSDVKRGDKLTK